ncbi:MAG TPA: hypothetical protein PK625_05080, partial [Spirochaetales bacterium]|nr:hypothetical protein [Spirochaetales bacterium]
MIPIRSKLIFAVGIPFLVLVGAMVAFSSVRFSNALKDQVLSEAIALAKERSAVASNYLSSGVQVARDLAAFAKSHTSLPLNAKRSILSQAARSTLESNDGLLAAWYIFEPDILDGNDASFQGAPGHTLSGRFVPYWYRGSGDELVYEYAT